MRHLRSHADALAQRGVRVNSLTAVHCICAHFNRQSNLANPVTRVRADHAAAQDLAVARPAWPSTDPASETVWAFGPALMN